ncbi:hypothetical protein [uncultured Clostridium sp.]|uniref:hypothetical protein n=1 Tax=uncultured Clostridium sp. TaxID=59620 RepID=UPI002634C3E0|nr:hypothetical protein [uncultured Clostridium sp.]
MELLDKLNNVTDLSYWDYGHKGIFLFNDGVCAHIKMSREKFNEIEDKYYGEKLKNIISDSGIRNKQNRKKRVNWEGFEELYYNGYDYKEIAKIIGCGTATVVRKVQESIELGKLNPRKKGILANSKNKEILKEFKRNEVPKSEVALYFKCSESTIQKAFKDLKDMGEL